MKMVLVAALLLTSAARRHARGVTMHELSEGDAGQKVTLTTGEALRVTLRENAGTGYQWQAEPGCDAVLHLEHERATQKSPGTPGASGARVWVYIARVEGACELRFVSARSWEKTAAGKTLAFSVSVAKAG